jgi:hypothetical protein
LTEICAKIRFNLDPNDWHSATAERIWAEPVGEDIEHAFRLMNSPFYARGVSFLDIVRAEEAHDGTGLEYAGTIRRSGHSTIWLLVPLGSSKFAEHWDLLHSKDCTYESTTMDTQLGMRTLYSVDVPTTANFDEIRSILEEGHRQGVWIFQVGHQGHGASTPLH